MCQTVSDTYSCRLKAAQKVNIITVQGFYSFILFSCICECRQRGSQRTTSQIVSPAKRSFQTLTVSPLL